MVVDSSVEVVDEVVLVVFAARSSKKRLSIGRTRSCHPSQVWESQVGRISLRDLVLPSLDLSHEVVKRL